MLEEYHRVSGNQMETSSCNTPLSGVSVFVWDEYDSVCESTSDNTGGPNFTAV